MFFITRKKYEQRIAEIDTKSQADAIKKLVDLLRNSDKIYLEPVTLIGDNQTIRNCTFLGINGTALTIKAANDKMEQVTK